MENEWKLVSFDTFAETFYHLPGTYVGEKEARQAGALRLEELNKNQPPETSGGQDDLGIQDRIFVQRPDGSRFRFIPTPEEFGQKPV